MRSVGDKNLLANIPNLTEMPELSQKVHLLGLYIKSTGLSKPYLMEMI